MTHSGSYQDLPLLSGPNPGLLDPSQRSRLLRTPTSSLFFAAFDPLTARSDGVPNISALHIGPGGSSKRAHLAGTNGKRIVIETDPESGTCSWRFVPRARLDDDALTDDGPWPRVVELCGRTVRMTQDQWDIHKLDPAYDCVVRVSPKVAMITRIAPKGNVVEADTTPAPDLPGTPKMTSASLDDATPTPRAKRNISPTSQFESPPKRPKTSASVSHDSDRMVVDEDVFFSPPVSKAAAAEVTNGKKRRRVSVRLGDTEAGNTPERPSVNHKGSFASTEPSSKARAHGIHDYEVPSTPAKRVRTRSPDTVRREMGQKRADRERKRKADMDMRVREHRKANHLAFWREIGIVPRDDEEELYQSESEAGPEAEEPSDPSDSARESSDNEHESLRLSMIEESKRKLTELEKDKPLWEESARKRQEREVEEERMRQRARAKREEQERIEERMRSERRRREEQREQERKDREREIRVKEQSGRMFVYAPRGALRWNPRLSLERYIRTAADFDAAKFPSAGKPMTFASVPWPVLRASFSVQDVDWDAVENFFREVQRLLKPAEFQELVEKSHRRFHPDRWRSRGLLVSVKNETERDLLEVAGSTVAQAVTPLWKEVTGR